MRTRSLKRKISNALLLVLLLVIAVGIYYNIFNSRAETVLEVPAIAIDNYGYLENEEFNLEAKKVEDELYEIEMPESVNTKKVLESIKVTLESLDSQETSESILEINDNKIQLSKEQIDNNQINIELAYDVAILEQDQQGSYIKNLLSEKTEEERETLEITEETEILYNKILKYEEEESGKLVEIRGFLPKEAQLQTKETTQEKLQEIFVDKQIDVAYDLEILTSIENEDGTTELQELNLEEMGEIYEVSIKDARILANSKVYHVKDDNTYEEVTVKENTEGAINFETTTFSIYAVTSDDGSESTHPTEPEMSYTISQEQDTTWSQEKEVIITLNSNYRNRPRKNNS